GRSAPAVLHFEAGAVLSDRALCGPATGLTHPVALALDASGRLFVANGFGGVVAVYAPGATGDAAPLRTFTPACGDARSLAVGAGLLVVGGACVCVYDVEAGAGARPEAVFGHIASLPLQGADGLALDLRATGSLIQVADFAGDAVHAVGPSATGTLRGPAT